MRAEISYQAERIRPLDDVERWEIAKIVATYSVDRKVIHAIHSGQGPQWHPMAIGDPDPERPHVVFEGTTPLPEGDLDSMWEGVQYWCRVLTEIRRLLNDAEWQVAVDDHEIPWDEETRAFDPNR